MLFNSPSFVLFFVLAFAGYWALPGRRSQNAFLLLASWFFYGTWSVRFLGLLMISTVVDYSLGLAIARATDPGRRRRLLLISLATNLGFLGYFKYAGFFVTEAAHLLAMLGISAHPLVLQVVLPLGISFYTFQSLSYVIDVYRRKVEPTRSLVEYGLFVAFFPHLVAGPIMRAGGLLSQIQAPRQLTRTGLESGALLIVWGLFKKIVIADNLAPYVNAVYANPTGFDGFTIFTATVFFAFQIYGDFSGYSDTARGLARMLGFELVANFDLPYFSRTPVEFWRRWHISLSQWFQDYLYFPLAMHYLRAGGWASKYRAHIIAMTLIGFWHGANWTFVAFGLYWGLVIAGYLYLQERTTDRAPAAPGIPLLREAGSMAVMFAVVLVGWVLFRSPSLAVAGQVLGGVLSAAGTHGVVRPEVLPAWLLWSLVAGLWIGEALYRRTPQLLDALGSSVPAQLLVRNALLACLLVAWLAAQQARVQPFIYFQF